MLVAIAASLVLLTACSDDEPAAETTTTTVAVTTTVATPTFTGDRDSPFCTVLRDVDITAVLAGAGGEDPAAVGEAVRQLVDLLVQVTELAPEEIAADVALVAGGMTSLDAALAEVGYDFDALAASGSGDEVLEAVNAPAFADAGVRLAAYRGQVCEL